MMKEDIESTLNQNILLNNELQELEIKLLIIKKES